MNTALSMVLLMTLSLSLTHCCSESEDEKRRSEALDGINALQKKISDKHESAKKAHFPKIIKNQPSKPSPVGLFAPISFGMTLNEILKAQPAISVSSEGSRTGVYETLDGEQFTKTGYSFYERSVVKLPGAFPWKWGTKDVNVNPYVLVEGPMRTRTVKFGSEDIEEIYHLGDASKVVGFKIDFFQSQIFYKAALDSLSKLWGQPQAVKHENINSLVWFNGDDDTCVFLIDDSSTKNYSLSIQRCWTASDLVDTILYPADDKDSIVVSTYKQFVSKHSEYSAVKRGDSKGTLNLPFFAFNRSSFSDVGIAFKGEHITELSWEDNAPADTQLMITGDGKFLPARTALSKALKGKLPDSVISAASKGEVEHKLKSGSLSINLGKSFKFSLKRKNQ